MSHRQLFSSVNNHTPHVSHCPGNNLLGKGVVDHSQNKWTLRQKIHLSITIALFLLCLVVIAVYIREVTRKKSKVEDGIPFTNQSRTYANKICYDAGCIETAARILKYVDENENPCHDFYQYACGSWFKKNSIPENKASWSTFSLLEEENNKIYKKILEKKDRNASEAATKLRLFYSSCLTAASIEKLQVDPVKNLISQCDYTGNGKKFDIAQALSHVQQYFPPYLFGVGQSPLFETKVIVDKTKSSRYIIQISQPNIVPQFLRSTNLMSLDEIKLLKGNVGKSSLDILGSIFANKSTDRWKLEEGIKKLHKQLKAASVPIEQLRDVKRTSQVLKVSQLNKETGREFPWLRYLNSVLKPVHMKLNKSSLVTVKALQYIKKMVAIVKDTPREVLNYYFLLNLIVSLTKFTTGQKTSAVGPRWVQCTEVVQEHMGMVLGSLYIKDHFENKSIQHIDGMVQDIKETFIENLKNVEWMDEKTKIKAKEKAQKMEASIGYPSFLKDEEKVSKFFSEVQIDKNNFVLNIANLLRFEKLYNLRKLGRKVDRDEWNHPPTLVNAFYDVGRNKMVFFAGILHSPFYSKKGLMSLNFGSMGTVMGHEFSHGFDDKGRLYDSDGSIHEWWTPESSRSFEKQANCIEKQYSKYSYAGVHLNGKVTLGENLADNIGLKISFQAYQRWIKENGLEQKLPGIKFTGDQLFFLGYAQTWCSIETEASMLYGMTSHSPSMFRVFGSLYNSPDFARVFKCKKNSQMNPQDKCSVW